MMQTDVKGYTCPANAATTVYSGRTRLKGLFFSASAATTLIVSDGTTTLFTYNILAAATDSILIPGEGVLCLTSLIITTTTLCAAVAYYG